MNALLSDRQETRNPEKPWGDWPRERSRRQWGSVSRASRLPDLAPAPARGRRSREPATDLEAVADALKLRRFPLIGSCQGGAVVVAYAARHPERVSRLVLYDSYP